MPRGESADTDTTLAALRERLLARTAVRLAHDLNNDLTVIAGQVELAQRPGATRIEARLEQARRAATDAAHRSRLVLELARARQNDLQPGHPDEVALDLHRLARLLLGRDVDLKLTCTPETVAVDPTQLRLVAGAIMLASLPESDGPRPHLSLALSRWATDLELTATVVQAPPAPAWLAAAIAACGNGQVTPSSDGWQVVARIPASLPRSVAAGADRGTMT